VVGAARAFSCLAAAIMKILFLSPLAVAAIFFAKPYS
jgi:hypothetical protein